MYVCVCVCVCVCLIAWELGTSKVRGLGPNLAVAPTHTKKKLVVWFP